MIKKIISSIFALLVVFSPYVVFAQPISNLTELINRFKSILGALIPLLFGVALVGFLWGVSQFIFHADDETKRKEGRQVIIYGIIGLFFMTAIWGIVALLGNTFGISLDRVPRL